MRFWRKKPIAEVFTSCGRQFLSIKGVAVAMEGDPCRDPDIVGPNQWTGQSLEDAARRINGKK